jgi:uncharacterized protein (TIGR03437 family)
VIESSGAGTLRAYDATNLANELYDSGQNKARDGLGSYVKFSAPTIVNGKVYVGTQNSLAVFGLLGAPALGANGVVNGANFVVSAVAPGSIVTLLGQNLATAVATASYPLPFTLGGSSLTIGGLPAPLYYASPRQIDAQVPFEVPPGPAAAVLTAGGTPLLPATLTVQAVAPELFIDESGHAVVNSPAVAGSMAIVFATGLGSVANPVATGAAAPSSPPSTTTAPVTATLGGQAAAVSSAQLEPGVAGVYEVAIQIPSLAPGDYPLVITIGGVSSNSAPITVSAGP